MQRLQQIATAAILLFLGACAELPQTGTSPGNWQAQRERIKATNSFTARAKTALRTPGQPASASLLGHQLGESSHLRVSGPMGLSATTVDSNGKQVVVRQGDDTRSWDIDDPDLQSILGLNLPLRALQSWLKGVPAPELELEQLSLDPSGELPQSLQQRGWRVDYQGFASFEGYLLPTRLEISRDTTSARIILRQWEGITAL